MRGHGNQIMLFEGLNKEKVETVNIFIIIFPTNVHLVPITGQALC